MDHKGFQDNLSDVQNGVKRNESTSTSFSRFSINEVLGLTSPQAWWRLLNRLLLTQISCSVIMQLSYVAFPAYNFALALWCLVFCHKKWVQKVNNLLFMQMIALFVSVLTDIIWASLWVSGNVFYDQFCGENGVSIISCSGSTSYFPGCRVNRVAVFMLIINILAKVGTIGCMYRIQKFNGFSKQNAEVAGQFYKSSSDEVAPPTQQNVADEQIEYDQAYAIE